MSGIHHHRYPASKWTTNQSNMLVKLKLAREGILPTHSQIRQNLGSQLADIFFDNLPLDCLEVIGLQPILEGPGNNLWSSPSDQLIGKLVIKPPLSRRHKQALTHQAILEIGGDLLLKAAYEAELKEREIHKTIEVNRSQETREDYLRCIKEVALKERNKYNATLEVMRQRFTEEFDEKVEILESQFAVMLDIAKKEALAVVKEQLVEERMLALQAKEEFLLNAFRFNFEWEARKLREEYDQKLSDNLRKWQNYFLQAKETSNRQLKRLELIKDTEHLSDITRVINNEKHKANAFIKEIIEKYEEKISELQQALELNGLEMEKLKQQHNLSFDEILSWKCLTRDLVNQFQKFIHFVFENEPEETTKYLLDFKELMNRKIDLESKDRTEASHQEKARQDFEKTIESKFRLKFPSSKCLLSAVKFSEKMEAARIKVQRKAKKETKEWIKLLLEGLLKQVLKSPLDSGTMVNKPIEDVKEIPSEPAPTSVPSQTVLPQYSLSEPKLKVRSESYLKMRSGRKIARRSLKPCTVRDIDDTDEDKQDIFVNERAESILNIFKNHRSLMRLIVNPER